MTQHAVMERLFKKYVPLGGIGCEIGVWRGEGAQKLLECAEPRKLYLIDPWIPPPPEHIEKYMNACWRDYDAKMCDTFYFMVMKKFAAEREQGRVEVIRAKSQDAAILFPNNYLDWVYIDGDHSYDAVLKDLEFYTNKTQVGGFLLGDDYYGGDWCYQVGVAVDDFMGVHDGKAVEWVQKDGEQYILRKIGQIEPKPPPKKPSPL